ncbi:uncharacterized protein DMAD_03256 [Drosophila madeirensis]|uniref:Proteasome assembly chaperone 3 n=1 Tax=Drosophila madeirensis TaxID=30013 RepID=A0AAU9G9C8_DROMD
MENLRISDTAAAGDAVQLNGHGYNQEAGGFTSHMTILDNGPAQFIVRVLKMNGSTMLIINSKESEVFDELAVGMPPRDSTKSDALSSTILGGYGQTESSVLAAKLSKRYRRQFFVSLNIGGDRLVTPLFEKSLVTYMQNHLDHFV